MTTDLKTTQANPASAITPELDALISERVEAHFAAQKAKQAKRQKRMAIIATKGTLDMAYPPLILASTAASLGYEVGVFFTFYGLNILHDKKRRKLSVAPLGNPAAPPMPGLNMPVPNLLGAIPGMTRMGTVVMKKIFKSHNVATIDELLDACIESGVRLMPCQMTADVFGYKQEQFHSAAETGCGAATFIRFAAEADISLFV